MGDLTLTKGAAQVAAQAAASGLSVRDWVAPVVGVLGTLLGGWLSWVLSKAQRKEERDSAEEARKCAEKREDRLRFHRDLFEVCTQYLYQSHRWAYLIKVWNQGQRQQAGAEFDEIVAAQNGSATLYVKLDLIAPPGLRVVLHRLDLAELSLHEAINSSPLPTSEEVQRLHAIFRQTSWELSDAARKEFAPAPAPAPAEAPAAAD